MDGAGISGVDGGEEGFCELRCSWWCKRHVGGVVSKAGVDKQIY